MTSSTSSNAVPVGTWIETANHHLHTRLPAMLTKGAVVLLGEEHGQAEHHRWQLHTIAALHGERPEMMLGFEMFPRRTQPVLDRWSAGELGEKDFLRQADWEDVWGMDATLYLPLFHFARMHRLPMLALNIDRATARKVAAQGFASVPIGEREGVGEPAPARDAYRARLSGVFRMHPHASGAPAAEPERFERFIRGQLFWDRAMAEAIAGALRAAPRALVVGIMGRGHLEYGDGVPHQLGALGISDVATALPWPENTEYPIRPSAADLLFGVAPRS